MGLDPITLVSNPIKYNGNNIIPVTGGNATASDIVSGDLIINPTLIAKSASDLLGTHAVTIESFELTGADIANYTYSTTGITVPDVTIESNFPEVPGIVVITPPTDDEKPNVSPINKDALQLVEEAMKESIMIGGDPDGVVEINTEYPKITTPNVINVDGSELRADDSILVDGNKIGNVYGIMSALYNPTSTYSLNANLQDIKVVTTSLPATDFATQNPALLNGNNYVFGYNFSLTNNDVETSIKNGETLVVKIKVPSSVSISNSKFYAENSAGVVEEITEYNLINEQGNNFIAFRTNELKKVHLVKEANTSGGGGGSTISKEDLYWSRTYQSVLKQDSNFEISTIEGGEKVPLNVLQAHQNKDVSMKLIFSKGTITITAEMADKVTYYKDYYSFNDLNNMFHEYIVKPTPTPTPTPTPEIVPEQNENNFMTIAIISAFILVLAATMLITIKLVNKKKK